MTVSFNNKKISFKITPNEPKPKKSAKKIFNNSNYSSFKSPTEIMEINKRQKEYISKNKIEINVDNNGKLSIDDSSKDNKSYKGYKIYVNGVLIGTTKKKNIDLSNIYKTCNLEKIRITVTPLNKNGISASKLEDSTEINVDTKSKLYDKNTMHKIEDSLIKTGEINVKYLFDQLGEEAKIGKKIKIQIGNKKLETTIDNDVLDLTKEMMDNYGSKENFKIFYEKDGTYKEIYSGELVLGTKSPLIYNEEYSKSKKTQLTERKEMLEFEQEEINNELNDYTKYIVNLEDLVKFYYSGDREYVEEILNTAGVTFKSDQAYIEFCRNYGNLEDGLPIFIKEAKELYEKKWQNERELEEKKFDIDFYPYYEIQYTSAFKMFVTLKCEGEKDTYIDWVNDHVPGSKVDNIDTYNKILYYLWYQHKYDDYNKMLKLIKKITPKANGLYEAQEFINKISDASTAEKEFKSFVEGNKDGVVKYFDDITKWWDSSPSSINYKIAYIMEYIRDNYPDTYCSTLYNQGIEVGESLMKSSGSIFHPVSAFITSALPCSDPHNKINSVGHSLVGGISSAALKKYAINKVEAEGLTIEKGALEETVDYIESYGIKKAKSKTINSTIEAIFGADVFVLGGKDAISADDQFDYNVEGNSKPKNSLALPEFK